VHNYLEQEEYLCYNKKIKIEESDNMAGSTEYKNKWQAKNCDRISLVVAKGQKDILRNHAESINESLNGFINRAIYETMERDKKQQEMNKNAND